MTPAEDIARGEALADRDHAREQEFAAAEANLAEKQARYDETFAHMGRRGDDPTVASQELAAAKRRMQAAEVAMQELPRQRDGGAA